MIKWDGVTNIAYRTLTNEGKIESSTNNRVDRKHQISVLSAPGG